MIRRGLLAFFCVLALTAALLRDNPVVSAAQGYAADVATTAAASYVTLRTLNAFLSTAQEIEVGLSFIASGSARPLKVLEPIDDTVERIAGLVFGVMVATGVIAVALGPVSAIGLGLLSLALGIWALSKRGHGGLPRRLAWYGGFLGLALPLALVVSEPLAGTLTEGVYDRNMEVIEEITARVGGSEALGEEEPGLTEYRQLASNLWSRADELIGALLAVLGVHVFRIFLLPLLLVGGLFVVARHYARD